MWTSESNSELVPECYFMPELMMNRNLQHSGSTKESYLNNKSVKLFTDEMRMPPWASNSFDLVRVMR